MKEAGVRSVAVEIDGALEGILTERDLLNAVASFADLDRDPVSNWMTDDPDSIGLEEAANRMLTTGYRHLPVVDGLNMLGVVSIEDVLWAIAEPLSRGGSQPMASFPHVVEVAIDEITGVVSGGGFAMRTRPGRL